MKLRILFYIQLMRASQLSLYLLPESTVHGATLGSPWDHQDLGGPMKLVIYFNIPSPINSCSSPISYLYFLPRSICLSFLMNAKPPTFPSRLHTWIRDLKFPTFKTKSSPLTSIFSKIKSEHFFSDLALKNPQLLNRSAFQQTLT